MKKFLTAIAATGLCAAMAISFTACGNTSKAEVLEIDLSQEFYGIAVEKGNAEMKAAVDGVLEQLNGEGVTVDGAKVTFNSIYTAEMNAQEKNELKSIGSVKTASTNRANELVVATNAEFAPFEYMVGDSFGGIDMQVAKVIAQALNKELVVLHMDFEVVLNAVGTTADIGMAGLTINDERKQTVDFSVPYYETTQRIAILEGDTDFAECKSEADVINVLKSLENAKAGAATAQTGYYYLTGNESFEFEGFANLKVTNFNTIALAVQDLVNGKLKLVCGDKDTISAAVKAINK